MSSGRRVWNERIVIGIDPGLAGGIAILGADTAEVHIMPTLKDPRGRGKIINTRGIVAIIEATFKKDLPLPHVVIEAQRAMPGQGVRSLFTIGKGTGILEGICAALRVSFEFAGPRQWQKSIFAGMASEDTKAASIKKAQELFPDLSLLASDRCTRPHDGLADALLIAEFGRRVLAGMSGK